MLLNDTSNNIVINFETNDGSDNNIIVGNTINGTDGSYNIAIGYDSMLMGTTGSFSNIAIGSLSCMSYAGGTGNIAIGGASIASGLTGSNGNIAVGGYSLYGGLTDCYKNIAIGSFSLYNGVTGNSNSNIAIGDSSLYYGIGSGAQDNIAIGKNALYSGTNSIRNIAIGSEAMNNIPLITPPHTVTGNSNIAIGYQSLQTITSGSKNVAIGENSLGMTNSDGSIGIGYNAGFMNDGKFNTFLGYNTNISIFGATGSTALGQNSIITQSNQIVLGTSAETIFCNGNGTDASGIVIGLTPIYNNTSPSPIGAYGNIINTGIIQYQDTTQLIPTNNVFTPPNYISFDGTFTTLSIINPYPFSITNWYSVPLDGSFNSLNINGNLLPNMTNATYTIYITTNTGCTINNSLLLNTPILGTTIITDFGSPIDITLTTSSVLMTITTTPTFYYVHAVLYQ
jgi:hypothetical protein